MREKKADTRFYLSTRKYAKLAKVLELKKKKKTNDLAKAKTQTYIYSFNEFIVRTVICIWRVFCKIRNKKLFVVCTKQKQT